MRLCASTRGGAQVIAAERQNIESMELYCIIVPCRIQRVEMPSTPRMTASPSRTNCFCLFFSALWTNPGEAAAPVVPVARDEPHPLILADYEQAVAVVFDLVKPFRPGRHGFAGGRDAEPVAEIWTGR